MEDPEQQTLPATVALSEHDVTANGARDVEVDLDVVSRGAEGIFL